jgi:transposase
MARRESANIQMAHLAARCAGLESENRALRRHCRAAVREKEKLAGLVRTLEQTVESLRAALAKAEAALRELRHLHFGDHSERGPVPEASAADEAAGLPAGVQTATGAVEQSKVAARPQPLRRERGAQPDHRGHGRRILKSLPHVTKICTLPEDQRRCPVCGKPYQPLRGWFARSLLLDWTVQAFYHLYLRQRYRRDCACAGPKKILTAPPPGKVIAKGLLAARAIARVCVDKFWLGHPLHRILRALALEVPTLPVSQGGLTRTLQSVQPLLEPLYLAIRQRVREQTLAAADETTARVLPGDTNEASEDEDEEPADHDPSSEEDEPDEQPQPHRRRWWTWAFKAKDAIAFSVSRRRNTKAACAFFGWDPKNPPSRPLLILLTDCYSVYKTLARLGWVIAAYCWAHIRRKYVEAARTENSPVVSRWAEDWRQQIAILYAFNDTRRKAEPSTPAWQAADQALRAHAAAMRAAAERELREHELQMRLLRPRQTKALRTLLRHWAGLTLFLDHPEVPMDNNEMERILRDTVVGRKNYLFFGSPWAAHLAEMLWSILATAVLNGFNPLTYLTAYLQACADNGGRPLTGDVLARFLPWQASAADRAAWSQPLPSLPPDAFVPNTPAPRRRARPCRRPVPIGVGAPPPLEVDTS